MTTSNDEMTAPGPDAVPEPGPPREAPTPPPFDPFADVLAFHRKFGCVVGTTPAVPALGTALLRIRLIDEEVEETVKAIEDGDLPGIADGLADAMYVLLGTAISYGISLPSVWAAVHAGNMTKTGRADAGGKIMKGSAYVHPDIAAILAKQGPIA